MRAPGRYCFLWRLWHASARGGPATLLLPAVLQLAEGFAADHACACSDLQPLRPCPAGLDSPGTAAAPLLRSARSLPFVTACSACTALASPPVTWPQCQAAQLHEQRRTGTLRARAACASRALSIFAIANQLIADTAAPIFGNVSFEYQWSWGSRIVNQGALCVMQH